MSSLAVLLICLLCSTVSSFFTPISNIKLHNRISHSSNTLYLSSEEQPPDAISVTINTTLTDTKIKKLFAWIKCAFAYDGTEQYANDYAYYYNNIELAIAAAFGDNLPKNSVPMKLMDMALKKEGLLEYNEDGDIVSTKEWEEILIGDEIGRRDRESASLGASKSTISV